MGLRVYVATKFENQEIVRKAFELLRSAGHEITHDWTTEVVGDRTGEYRKIFLEECAIKDCNGVADADVILVINYPGGCGMFTELGLGLAYGALIVVVDGDKPPYNIFYNLPEVTHANSLEHAIEIINAIDKQVFSAEELAHREVRTLSSK